MMMAWRFLTPLCPSVGECGLGVTKSGAAGRTRRRGRMPRQRGSEE